MASGSASFHMGLAVVLGIALSIAFQIVVERSAHDGATFSFVVGSPAVVQIINYFDVLPAVSPGFVDLIPFAVTLASKLALGFAEAPTLHMLPAPLTSKILCLQHGDVTVPVED